MNLVRRIKKGYIFSYRLSFSTIRRFLRWKPLVQVTQGTEEYLSRCRQEKQFVPQGCVFQGHPSLEKQHFK